MPVVLHVDPAPFFDSLRRLYQDEYCDSVLRATLLYQNQIAELESARPMESTAADTSASFLPLSCHHSSAHFN